MESEVHIHFVYLPLEPDRVRWYSYRAPYLRKELSKATEVPHRGSLLRFCDSDNAALEAAYRSRQDELERLWWEEEAELQRGEAASGDAEGSTGLSDDWSYYMGSSSTCNEEEPGVLVRSGAFEVDLSCRQLRPCYWPAARHRVLRGTWFAEKGGEWVPLKESLAEQLEEGYRQSIWLPQRGRLQPQVGGGSAARLDLTTHVEKGLYALFVSEEEIYLGQDTGWAWLRKIGASSTAGQQRLRVRRGYEQPAAKALLEKEADLRQEELDEACAAAPVSRLVLVVHGIGQKLQGANIAQDAASFRSLLRQVAQDQSQQGLLDERAASGRTEVLPVQWRKHLFIEADHLSRALMPPGIPALRHVLHSTVVEILLFMTPHHRAEIVASLVTSLNAAHARFLRRNPHFKGSVSILAHSLGTVLCYDILCAHPLSPQLVDGSSLLSYSPLGSPLAGTAAAAAGTTADAADAGAAPVPGSPSTWRMAGMPGSPAAQAQQLSGTQQLPAGGLGGLADSRRAAAEAESGDPMVIDLTSGSPSSPHDALQQEVARLRSENRRLQLQLDVARSAGGLLTPPASPPQQQQLELLKEAGDGPSPWHQQQQQQGLLQSGASPAAARAPGAAWPGLNFSVDALIMLGSPLGCFLALRGVNQAQGTGLGTAASAPLMQLAPGQPFSPDGLPAVRRLLNVYHPYDPVAHRIEPLAVPADRVQRAAFVPLFKGGKRIHLAVQEFSEDVGSAASRIGSSLLSSLAFAKFKSSASYKAAEGAGEGGAPSTAAATAADEAAAEAAAEVDAARRLPANHSAPALGARELLPGEGAEEALAERQLYTSLSFGVADEAQPGTLSAEASGTLAASPTKRQQLGGGPPGSPAAPAGLGGSSRSASGIARVADGEAAPGSKSARGRLDFVMQESSLENQYLSALSAHFVYWTSVDVALFVLRAVHGLDVLTGASKQQAEAPAADQAAEEAKRRRELQPTSPRQHLVALP